ncbi:hypothetical protein [Siphoviridae environmental samples]|nr:hypothetical protein [Siphoviridae environmental samples]
MANIDPAPSWANIRRLETTDRNMAGPGGILNDPTTSIAARLNLLRDNDTTLGNSVAAVNSRQDATDSAIATIQGQVLTAPGTLSDLENGAALDPAAAFPNVPSVENSLGPVDAINSSIEALTARSNQLLSNQNSTASALAGAGGSSLIGFMQSGAGSIARTLEEKSREWVSPLDKGAAGNGAADDSTALVAAGQFIILPAGRTFRVSTNSSIGAVLFAGGQILVDAGVTLTVSAVLAPASEIVFQGSGIVKISNQQWSLGWFSGSTANAKWDFLRRGLTWNVPYVCQFSAPKAGDPAAVLGSSGEWWWKVSAPMQFDDPENEGVFYVSGGFRCTATMQSGFLFSPVNKTENIMFIGLLRIDGQLTCDYPVHIKGGARLKFIGELRPTNGVENLRVDTSLHPVDELEIDILHSTRFSRYAANFIGTDGARPMLHCRFGHLMTNGATPGSTPSDFFNFEGVIRSVSVDMVTSHVDGSLVAPSSSVVRVTNNAVGAPQFGIRFGTIANRVSTCSGIRLVQTAGGTAKPSVSVGDLYSSGTSALPTAQLLWSQYTTINKIEPAGSYVNVSADCIDTSLPRVDLWRLTDAGIRTRIEGVLTRSMTAGTTPLANDTATAFNLLDSNTRRTGILSVATSADNNSGVFHVRVGSSPLLRALAVGGNVNVTTGVLTGTTGVVGKFTVSVAGDSVYLENRTGGQLDLHATCT